MSKSELVLNGFVVTLMSHFTNI